VTGRSRSRSPKSGLRLPSAIGIHHNSPPAPSLPPHRRRSSIPISEDDCTCAARKLRRKSAHIDVITDELNAEMASFVNRSTAMEQRATILIGAASVVGALQVSMDFSWLTIANLGLSFIAAAAGVIVVFPRRGDALDVRTMRDGFLSMELQEGRGKLISTKLEVLEADEHWLSVRGHCARVGFIALALSIGITLAGSFVPGSDSSSGTSPTPSPQVSVSSTSEQ
jgi:hypothetical protein